MRESGPVIWSFVSLCFSASTTGAAAAVVGAAGVAFEPSTGAGASTEAAAATASGLVLVLGFFWRMERERVMVARRVVRASMRAGVLRRAGRSKSPRRMVTG